MLAIRLQRTGRKGHAMFRIIVQDSRRSPSSGKVVALLGNYDPHSKTVNLDKEKTTTFLNSGAQPSDRLIGILKAESIKLPKWAEASPSKKKAVRNPEKRRSTAPEPKEKPAEAASEEPEEQAEETSAETEKIEASDEQADTTNQPAAEEPSEEASKVEEGPAAEAEPTTQEKSAEKDQA